MALVVNDRVKETSTTTGTGTFDLAGAASGFQTFVAGIGDTNTTYYAIFNQGTTEWEVGLGTVTDATPDTLARTTVLESSNSDAAVDFAAGTKDVFCTLPASRVVFGKQEGTDFSNSLLVGHSTTGTLDAAGQNTGVGIASLDALTSGDENTALGRMSGTSVTTGSKNTLIGSSAGQNISTAIENTAIGYQSLQIDSTSGSQNTAIGMEALKAVVGGDYNIGLGWKAGDALTSGKGNVVIGSNIDADSNTGDRQLKIAGYDGSTTTTWMTGDSSGNVVFAGTATANGSLLATQGDATALAVALG